MVTEETKSIQEEQTLVLLGLAATKPEPAEACLSAEQLAAFIDGQLSLPRRKAIMAHLNSCETCYREWLEVAHAIAELQPQAVPSRKRAWWQRLREAWPVQPRMIPLAAALAMSLVVMALVIQKPQETWQIPQLAATVQNHPGLDQALAALPRELADVSFGFSDRPQDPAKQAFSEGFKQARRWLEGNSAVEDAVGQHSPWRDYYDLGQWTLLTWMLAQAEGVSPKEWQGFIRHCQSLITRFEQRAGEEAAKQALTSLREIHALLNNLARRPDPAQKTLLTRKLQLTIQQFLI